MLVVVRKRVSRWGSAVGAALNLMSRSAGFGNRETMLAAVDILDDLPEAI
jgi:hypothetical protein